MAYSYLKAGAAGLFCVGLAGCSWFGLEDRSPRRIREEVLAEIGPLGLEPASGG